MHYLIQLVLTNIGLVHWLYSSCSEVLRCRYGPHVACMVASCAPSSLCLIVTFGKKSGYTSKEGTMMGGSKSSGPLCADMAVGNEDH